MKIRKYKLIFFLLFSRLNFVFAQNQGTVSTGIPPMPSPTPVNSTTLTPVTVPNVTDTALDKKKSETTKDSNEKSTSPGKYAEHQSICIKNEYDKIAYYSASLKENRINLLKIKMADEKDQQQFIKIEMELAKEYIDQREKIKFNELTATLKSKKLTTLDNEYLNALIAFSNLNYNAARTILNKLLIVNPREINALLLLAEVYLAEQNFYEAGTIYEDLNKLMKNAYLVEQCQTLVLNFFNADGEKFCLQAADKFPENPFPLIFTGITYRERNDLVKAQEFFSKSIQIKPSEMGYSCLAEIFFMKQNYKESSNQFKKSMTFNSRSERALLGLAWSELKQKNYEESLQSFKKACKLNGKNEFELRRAYKVLSADKIPEARKFIELSEFCGG